MYSSEVLERFYFQYQTETFSHGESLQSFCVRNKVPYNIFQKWYKDTRKKIVPVQVDGISGTGEPSGLFVNSENPVSVSTPSIRIWIEGVETTTFIYSQRISCTMAVMPVRRWRQSITV